MSETVEIDGKKFTVIDKRSEGFYCVYCKQFSKEVQMDERGLWNTSEDGSTLIYKKDQSTFTPRVVEVWRVFQHYCGCRGWE